MSGHPGIEVVDALALPIPRLPVPAAQHAAGEPSVGSAELFDLPGVEVGVWELGVGAVYDTEVDEVFVVLGGEATVEVLDRSGLVSESVELSPGALVRLHAGTRTRWIVRRTLRKVYLIPTAG